MEENSHHHPDFDQKLRKILLESARVFAEKGFHNASIRDISRATGVSLAGLYYYFKNKEELLFLILQNAFDHAIKNCRDSIGQYQGQERVRFFIRNYLETFVENLFVAKVVVHEAEFLTGSYRQVIQEKQKEYFDLLLNILDEQVPSGDQTGRVDAKLAALALFGMMNWIYTWYNPEKARSVEELADSMTEIFLRGFLRS